MKDFIAALFSEKSIFSGQNEGLPYWIFYLLLCVILLLVIFIFLRDKDLRQRINSFFFRIKKKLIKFRLQSRLRIIEKKKTSLVFELGKKAWEKGIQLEENSQINSDLDKLEGEKKGIQREIKKAEGEIADLKTVLENHNRKYQADKKEKVESKKNDEVKANEIKEQEKRIEKEVIQSQKDMERIIREINLAKKEKHELEVHDSLPQEEKAPKIDKASETIQVLSKKRDELDEKIKDSVEKKQALHKERKIIHDRIADHQKKIKQIEETHKKQSGEFLKEVKEWEKSRQKAQDKINKIEKQKEPLYEKMGKLADAKRIEDEDLTIYYSKIDRRNKRIEDTKKQIKELDS